jgi:murein lipoprotein
MATLTDNEIKELKDFIKEQFKEVNGKIDKLSEEVNDLRVDLANVKGELTGVNKRLDNIEFTNRTIFVAIVAALMAGLVKLFLPNLPTSP